jgi:hypothetical protein
MKAIALFWFCGSLFPAVVMTVDRLSPHGWFPTWVFYIWPTAYMLIPNSAIMNAQAYTIIVISAILNSLIYALVGFVLYKGIRTISHRKR